MSQPTQAEPRLVLIAEATKGFRDRYQALLEEAGHAVAVVPYDDAALSSRTMRPSLIILQLSDPSSTGLGMVRELRTQAETRGTPVITLVRFDDAHTREQIVRAGASAIMIDPVKRATIVRQIRRLLARAVVSGPGLPANARTATHTESSEASRA
jgi:DNA-binding response OmpR family regulator